LSYSQEVYKLIRLLKKKARRYEGCNRETTNKQTMYNARKLLLRYQILSENKSYPDVFHEGVSIEITAKKLYEWIVKFCVRSQFKWKDIGNKPY